MQEGKTFTIDTEANQFPSLTWHHLHINHGRFSGSVDKAALYPEPVLGQGVSLEKKSRTQVYGSELNLETQMRAGFDSAFDSVADALGLKVHEWTVAPGSKVSPLRISFTPQDGENSIADTVIHAESGSESTFIFDYSSAQGTVGLFGNRIRVFAEEGAQVHIVTVNLLSKGFKSFTALATQAKDNASVKVTQVELGGLVSYTGQFNHLEGFRSKLSATMGYVSCGQMETDVNYISRHNGRQSESNFATNGVVMDQAKKAWRGTIDFINGCVDSVGDEQEDVLLLDPRVVNKSMPVILCDEEQVEGRHGGSIGKLGPEMLFYMQSRGLDFKTAQSLLIKSKIYAVSRNIPDQALVEQIASYLEGAF